MRHGTVRACKLQTDDEKESQTGCGLYAHLFGSHSHCPESSDDPTPLRPVKRDSDVPPRTQDHELATSSF